MMPVFRVGDTIIFYDRGDDSYDVCCAWRDHKGDENYDHVERLTREEYQKYVRPFCKLSLQVSLGEF